MGNRIRRIVEMATTFERPAGAAVTDPPSNLDLLLARATAARASMTVTTREQAMRLSVVNRGRDITCGVLSTMAFTRTGRDGTDLGPGWLSAPDPNHTVGWIVSKLVDDLFFQGFAYWRVTVRDAGDYRPVAVEWMPYTETFAVPDGTGLVWWRRGHDQAGPVANAPVAEIFVPWSDVIVFESPIDPVLNATTALSIAAALDDAASRFAGNELAAGWLAQTDGDDLSDDEAAAKVALWQALRRDHVIGYVSTGLEYHESAINPSAMQLVEARSYQDAALARIVNLPAFAVGVGVPHDSMTYKTAATARFDVVDFGLAPIIGCITQTLSGDRVTAHGTTVGMEVDTFLRVDELASMGPSVTPTADVVTEVPTSG